MGINIYRSLVFPVAQIRIDISYLLKDKEPTAIHNNSNEYRLAQNRILLVHNFRLSIRSRQEGKTTYTKYQRNNNP